MRGDDAHNPVAFEYGDELGDARSGDALQRLDQRVVGLGDLEGAGHDALDVTVAARLQRLGDALPGDGPDNKASADDGEDILEQMDGALGASSSVSEAESVV